MNTNFFVDCRWYTTPCKTVLNADEFVVEFVTGKHSIVAKVSDKCYFLSIDDTTLSNIKCDFYFERNYNKPKEFLSNLYETFQNFLNTSIPFAERHFSHSTDDVIRRILELQEMKKEQLENVNENDYAKPEKELIEPEDKHIDDIKKFKEKADLNSSYEEATETKQETATDTETAEAEETTDPEIGEFVYDVRIHNDYGWDTYTVRADGLESAEYKAVRRMELETDEEEYSSIDVIRIYKEDSNELLKEIISKEREDPETADQDETAEKKMDDVLFETLIRNAKAFPPCDFPGATKLLNICQQMNKTQLSDFCKILIEKGIFTYEYGQIVTTKGRLLICPVSDMARGA